MSNQITDDKFSEITLADKEMFQEILNSCELYKDLTASEITFESLFCWGACEHPRKCVLDEGIVIYYEHEFGYDNVFYPPIVKRPEDFVPVIMKIVTYCRKKGIPVHLERMTKNLAELAMQIDCKQCRVIERRRDFEYLYNPTDLIELAGKKYKGKRNFVHGFMDRYSYEFVEYDPSMKDELMDFVSVWGRTHDELESVCEFKSIERCLEHLDDLNMFCDVIKIDGKIVAFAVGFINHANVGVVMFEKANTEYRGCYQAINNFFAKKHFANCRYINRQEDLGIENLRETKLSYHPQAFSDKYIYTDKPDTDY